MLITLLVDDLCGDNCELAKKYLVRLKKLGYKVELTSDKKYIRKNFGRGLDTCLPIFIVSKEGEFIDCFYDIGSFDDLVKVIEIIDLI
jgi:hypothetical protein